MLAMIVQPMRDMPESEIRATKAKAEKKLNAMGIEVLNTFFEDYPQAVGKNVPLTFLSRALSRMADCDLVYFCKGWEKNRGCLVEHQAAMMYGLALMYEEAVF